MSNASKSSATVSQLSSIEKRKIVEVLSLFPIYSVGGRGGGRGGFRNLSFQTKN